MGRFSRWIVLNTAELRTGSMLVESPKRVNKEKYKIK